MNLMECSDEFYLDSGRCQEELCDDRQSRGSFTLGGTIGGVSFSVLEKA